MSARPRTLAECRAEPQHRWEFRVPVGSLCKGAAWDRCRRSGLRAGIPQHAWRARHEYVEGLPTHWGWHTAPPDHIDYVAVLYDLPSCVPEGDLPAYLTPEGEETP